MKRKRKMIKNISIILCSLIMVINWGLAVHAAVLEYRTEVTNHIETGNIKISVKDYMLDENGKETEFHFDGEIVPGDYISKIPRVQNESSDCYIRIQTKYETEVEDMGDQCIVGRSDDWIKRGTYWYYQPVLQKGEKVDFYTGIQFPNWDNQAMEKTILMDLTVEAIQSRNFEPDYSLEDPWFGETAEYCLQEFGVEENQGSIQPMYVQLSGELTTNLSDFFVGLSTLMPGDQFNDSFQIKNYSDHEAEIFFHTEIPDITEDQRDLLNQISFSLTEEGKELYRGNLGAEEISNGISLGNLKSNEEKTIEFSLVMPKELKNAYAFRDSSVVWVFQTQEELLEEAPNTGDSSMIWIYVIAGGVAGLLLIASIISRKKETR